MIITDASTGLHITDTSINPLDFEIPDLKTATERKDSMILSASGWRGVFSADGDEESQTRKINQANRMLIAVTGISFFEWMKTRGIRNPVIAVGLDTRPTGAAIADVMVRTYLALGAEVRYLFIASTPEIMAYVKTDDTIDAFTYISASHNPVGHNGMKFGLGDGSILEATASAELKTSFLDAFTTTEYLVISRRVRSLSEMDIASLVEETYKTQPEIKKNALESYLEFMDRVVTGPVDESRRNEVMMALRTECNENPFGVIAELNGSARSTSIDRAFFYRLGIEAKFVNDTPGCIVHRIVPEGESLDPCRQILETAHAKEPRYQIGYVPDNDGDRGNLVYFDEKNLRSSILHVQEVFALSCLSELSYLTSIDPDPKLMAKTVIVVNGPTSLRIERIADLFGASVARAEVGEAHVVGKAAALRREGYRVRVLGEGSNGGTIIHPSTVRDPLSTIGAILKLLRLPGGARGRSPLAIWTALIHRSPPLSGVLSEVLETLPVFSTTGAYEDRAILKIHIPDHGDFKRAYENQFPDAFDSKSDTLRERFGFVSWHAVNYEGLDEKHGIGNRDIEGAQRGGLKILFADKAGIDRGFIWMRGSGTEPVFRVLADIEGDNPEGEAWLLNWHKELIQEVAGSL
jgi:phosphoglucomutase